MRFTTIYIFIKTPQESLNIPIDKDALMLSDLSVLGGAMMCAHVVVGRGGAVTRNLSIGFGCYSKFVRVYFETLVWSSLFLLYLFWWINESLGFFLFKNNTYPKLS